MGWIDGNKVKTERWWKKVEKVGLLTRRGARECMRPGGAGLPVYPPT